MGCKCSKEEENGNYETSRNHEDDVNIIGQYEDNVNYLTPKKSNSDFNPNESIAITSVKANQPIFNELNNSNNVTTVNNENQLISNFPSHQVTQQDNQTPSMSNYDQSFQKKKTKKKQNSYYNSEVLTLFNLARTKPLSFCKYIDTCISMITTNSEGQLVLGRDNTNKIGLKEGISKFNECKRYLLQIDSCDELEMDEDLVLELPEDSNLWLSNDEIKKLILDKQMEIMNSNKKKNYSIFGFHFDFGMVDSSVSGVLQLVDDNNCENRRRYNILNPEYKAVGISHRDHGKKFCSYFFFAG